MMFNYSEDKNGRINNKIFKPSILSISKTKENLFTYYCILQFITELTDKVNKNI